MTTADDIAHLRAEIQRLAQAQNSPDLERLAAALGEVAGSFDANVSIGGNLTGTLNVARQIIHFGSMQAMPAEMQQSIRQIELMLVQLINRQPQTGLSLALSNAIVGLESTNSHERFHAVESLAQLAQSQPHSGALGALRAALNHHFVDVRVYVIFRLGLTFHEDSILQKLERIYRRAADLCQQLTDQQLSLLFYAYDLQQYLLYVSADALLRYLAIMGIGSISSNQAFPILVDALTRDNWEVIRACAAQDLARYGSAARNVLTQALRDPALTVREQAAESLRLNR